MPPAGPFVTRKSMVFFPCTKPEFSVNGVNEEREVLVGPSVTPFRLI